MKKSSLSKYFLLVSITTFLSVFILLVHRSYINLITPTQEVKNSDLLKPIDPHLDTQSILDLEKRPEYNDTQIIIPTPSASVTPQVTSGPN